MNVPAHAGGVDLSLLLERQGILVDLVPAHAGGVDLSSSGQCINENQRRPRPCGRGGFKLYYDDRHICPAGPRPCGRGGFKQVVSFCPDRHPWSPPMRAGWI